MEKLLSVTEIIALGIPDLPTTKVGMRAFAERAKWEFETATGLGGTKRLYRLPAKYQRYVAGPAVPQQPETVEPEPTVTPIGMGQGSTRVDAERLEIAIRALAEWEQERGVKVADERRAAVIAILYDYAKDVTGEADGKSMAVVLRALG